MYKKKADSALAKFIKPVIWGVAASIATILIISVIAALIISKIGSGIGLTDYISTAALAVGCFVGGLVSAKLLKEMGLIIGAVTGAVSFIIIVLAAIAIANSNIGTVFLVRLAICVLASGIGGIIGVNSANRQKIVH